MSSYGSWDLVLDLMGRPLWKDLDLTAVFPDLSEILRQTYRATVQRAPEAALAQGSAVPASGTSVPGPTTTASPIGPAGDRPWYQAEWAAVASMLVGVGLASGVDLAGTPGLDMGAASPGIHTAGKGIDLRGNTAVAWTDFARVALGDGNTRSQWGSMDRGLDVGGQFVQGTGDDAVTMDWIANAVTRVANADGSRAVTYHDYWTREVGGDWTQKGTRTQWIDAGGTATWYDQDAVLPGGDASGGPASTVTPESAPSVPAGETGS